MIWDAFVANSLCFADDIIQWYPFYFRPRQFDIMEDGWQAFQRESELTRLISHGDHSWRISTINKDFDV